MGKIFISIILIVLTGCRKNEELMPSENWSQGCSTLLVEDGNYRLNAVCCEYVEFPFIRTIRNHTFQVSGTHYVFNAAKTIPYPVEVKGKLQGDSVLTIRFRSLGNEQMYRLNPGPAQMACLCACD